VSTNQDCSHGRAWYRLKPGVNPDRCKESLLGSSEEIRSSCPFKNLIAECDRKGDRDNKQSDGLGSQRIRWPAQSRSELGHEYCSSTPQNLHSQARSRAAEE